MAADSKSGDKSCQWFNVYHIQPVLIAPLKKEPKPAMRMMITTITTQIMQHIIFRDFFWYSMPSLVIK